MGGKLALLILFRKALRKEETGETSASTVMKKMQEKDRRVKCGAALPGTGRKPGHPFKED